MNWIIGGCLAGLIMIDLIVSNIVNRITMTRILEHSLTFSYNLFKEIEEQVRKMKINE